MLQKGPTISVLEHKETVAEFYPFLKLRRKRKITEKERVLDTNTVCKYYLESETKILPACNLMLGECTSSDN